MPKSVTYANFGGHPELEERVRRLLPAAESELGTAADRVAMNWTLREGGERPLVHLWLEDDWAGRADRAFSGDELREQTFRPIIRHMHDDLLAQFLRCEAAYLKGFMSRLPAGE